MHLRSFFPEINYENYVNGVFFPTPYEPKYKYKSKTLWISNFVFFSLFPFKSNFRRINEENRNPRLLFGQQNKPPILFVFMSFDFSNRIESKWIEGLQTARMSISNFIRCVCVFVCCVSHSRNFASSALFIELFIVIEGMFTYILNTFVSTTHVVFWCVRQFVVWATRVRHSL